MGRMFKFTGIAEEIEWKPTDIGGCILWLRSDLGVTKDAENRISEGLDQGGNNHHATQPTDSRKFVYTESIFGSLPGWYSDGADDLMDVADLFNHLSGSDIPYTYYFIGKWLEDWGTSFLSPLGFFSPNWATRIYNNLRPSETLGGLSRTDDAGNNILLSPPFTPNTNPFLWAIYFSGTTITAKFNATTIQDEGAMNVGTLTLATAVLGAFGFGSAGWNDNFFKGYHAEHVMYDTNLLGSADDTAFRAYINTRYGITV